MKNMDLSKLSRDEKLKLIDLLDEKNQRALEQRELYSPNEGQQLVHKSDKTLRACFAGNGSGKTALAVNEALWAATGWNPIRKVHSKVPARVIVLLDKPDKVADVWLPEIKKWYPLRPEQLEKRGKPYINLIRFDNGSEIIFMFNDQEPMSFESIELDCAIFDEPPSRHVFIALRRGGRKKGSRPWFLIIGTPIAAAWLRKEIYEPWAKGEAPDTECFKYGTHVNKANLADGYIESFGSVLSEKEKRIRFFGEFFDLEGLALAHLFDRERHLIKPPRWPGGWPTIVVIDPHPRKAHVAVLVGITKENDLVYLKEFSSRAPPALYAQELKDFYAGFRVVDIICDSLGSSELTGGDGNLSFIQVLKNQGVRVRATTYDEKQDEAFIQMIQNVMAIPIVPDNLGRKEPRLKISMDCKGIISDVESVEWQKYRNMDEFKPKLAIQNKDFLACLKYALAAQPRFTKGRERMIAPKGPRGWNARENWRKAGGTR